MKFNFDFSILYLFDLHNKTDEEINSYSRRRYISKKPIINEVFIKNKKIVNDYLGFEFVTDENKEELLKSKGYVYCIVEDEKRSFRLENLTNEYFIHYKHFFNLDTEKIILVDSKLNRTIFTESLNMEILYSKSVEIDNCTLTDFKISSKHLIIKNSSKLKGLDLCGINEVFIEGSVVSFKKISNVETLSLSKLSFIDIKDVFCEINKSNIRINDLLWGQYNSEEFIFEGGVYGKFFPKDVKNSYYKELYDNEDFLNEESINCYNKYFIKELTKKGYYNFSVKIPKVLYDFYKSKMIFYVEESSFYEFNNVTFPDCPTISLTLNDRDEFYSKNFINSYDLSNSIVRKLEINANKIGKIVHDYRYEFSNFSEALYLSVIKTNHVICKENACLVLSIRVVATENLNIEVEKNSTLYMKLNYLNNLNIFGSGNIRISGKTFNSEIKNIKLQSNNSLNVNLECLLKKITVSNEVNLDIKMSKEQKEKIVIIGKPKNKKTIEKEDGFIFI